ncbi:hypothetical protein RCG23_02230 [Neobacillus sp. PS3-34]|uniref:hypothetical protein n=1 Tax=Neobacillus sp. PS3-34 TaxID=3070678 RepID=UPI0027E0095C|nr:hypothetical protein [Neobacillus sp. PS3-34]WML48952.1 hypothetical protein RCG23_02230 [Neobacillus sp. PS3-34]
MLYVSSDLPLRGSGSRKSLQQLELKEGKGAGPVNLMAEIPVSVIFKVNEHIKALLKTKTKTPNVDNLILGQPFIRFKSNKDKNYD